MNNPLCYFNGTDYSWRDYPNRGITKYTFCFVMEQPFNGQICIPLVLEYAYSGKEIYSKEEYITIQGVENE